jgi:hypothetical protein
MRLMMALGMIVLIGTPGDPQVAPDANGALKACVRLKRGTVRIVSPDAPCRKKEQVLALSAATPLGFTDATLLNGWQDESMGTGTSAVGYARDARGVVHLRGTLNGMAAIGFVAFILPEGSRPAKTVFVSTMAVTGGVAGGVRVQSNGEVTPWDPSAFTPTNGVPTILDGVTFVAE